MKPPQKRATIGLSLQNLSTLKSKRSETLGSTVYRNLLCVIASAFDATATNSPCWISIGKNLQGDAFLLTVHAQGGKMYASGQSLEELASEAQSLLEPSEIV